MRQVRIGIDVGGTFTDAVAIDNETYEIIAQEKIPTTHNAKEGVAEGIITILQNLLQRNHIAPEEVVFIAHGTTQATNALLEGDVAVTGVLAMGSGMESGRAKEASDVGNISLAPGKVLSAIHEYVETEDAAASAAEIHEKLTALKQAGAEVIVATESFGVDDADNEKFVMNMAKEMGLYATGGHEVSQLYGLRVRTRTAVINGSLIPKMMETADMTEACVKRSGIPASLMIMRCDGGVMTVDEVRSRPILTMLSGLAAGVAGVLMYERLSDGIFLEAGGTSTDISVVKDGRVMVRYGEVGGHKTYLSSLDVRTLGVAGGSMIRVEKGKITDVGPRSAHIAGLAYEVFSPELSAPHLELVAPMKGDAAVYAAVVSQDGQRVSLTLAGAANLLGSVPENDYACTKEGKEAARAAWGALGKVIGCSAEEAAQKAMDIAAEKIWEIVSRLIREYELSPHVLCLAGGGGSGGVIVPYLGRKKNIRWKIVKNAPIISTIGVAMAMVREVVERTVVQPSEEDIRSIRREALEKILRSGAQESTVEIAIEIDRQANILRASAMGATELRKSDGAAKALSATELRAIAAESMALPPKQVKEAAATGTWHIFDGQYKKRLWGIIPITKHKVRVLNRNGVICLQREGLGAIVCTKADLQAELTALLEDTVEYGTTGGELPGLFAYYGEKQLNLSGLVSQEQVLDLMKMETELLPDGEKIIVLAVR
ncbi:hydantoinase/oxoprolinase family protein [Selenomonas ruminantium]|uniref:hydantoinase/oxoprolinase family protein n=1 Tax=Selenomonas ruminantium TaxID=971 RepID=UPI00041D1780|nr:hydantoinase/oxoprolinase family protein [Selenomonas ruminantium]